MEHSPVMTGCITALLTPFKGPNLDEDALRALVEAQIAGGVDGLVPCGTTGESPTLSTQEWERVIQITVETAAGRVPVMAGCGTNNTSQTVTNARRAQELGANALLVVAPYYNKPTQEGLFQHFKAVAEAVSIPVCVYNIPGRSVVNISPETFKRLAHVPGITSVKEATGDLKVATDIMLATDHQLTMLCGDDFVSLPFIAQGGHGVISVVSNVDPARTSRMIHSARGGDFHTARQLHLELFPLVKALFMETSPSPAKMALAMMGQMEETVRLPMVTPGESTRTLVRDALERLDLVGR